MQDCVISCIISCTVNTIMSLWNQEKNGKIGIKCKSYTEPLATGVVAVASTVVLTVVEVAGTVSGFGSGSGWGRGGCMGLVRGGSRMWVKGSIGRNNAPSLLCKIERGRKNIDCWSTHCCLICTFSALYNFSRLYLWPSWRLLLLLESLGTILFIIVKNHESRVDFPHC